MPTNYLERTGYRLPTEAEWEFACRAGAATARPFGSGTALLREYAWYIENSGNVTHPVGGRKPNELGIFDMIGNAFEWCQDRYSPYQVNADRAVADGERTDAVSDQITIVLRGGCFDAPVTYVRSAVRHFDRPVYRGISYGFRPVRTYPRIGPG